MAEQEWNRDSILVSIKKLLGLPEEYEQFDTDIIIHINSVFGTLRQLGVGPRAGFSISSKEDLWTDFMDNTPALEMVKSYIYFKVRLAFDPPSNSFVVDSMKKQADELEWRLNVDVETDWTLE